MSASALGRRRFRRLYYANALRYRAKHYSTAAVLWYRGLLLVGMAMRAVATLLTSRSGEHRSQELRGFMDVAGMAMRGLSGEATP